MSEYKVYKHPRSAYLYIRGTQPDGRPFFRSTKTKDKEAAQAICTRLNASRLKEQIHGPQAVKTFTDAASAYIKSGGEQKYLLRQNEDGSRHGLMVHFDGKLLSKITQDDLDAAAKAMCAPGASRETLIRNVYTPFIAVWNYAAAASRKWAEPRKWERPRKPKGTGVRALPQNRRAGSTPTSYERAWAFVQHMSPAPAMVMTALFYTGMRPIELFTLQCEDVNLKGRWIVLPSSKTGESRGVPMHEMLVPLLAGLLTRGDEVFRAPRGEPYPLKEDGGGQLKTAIYGARKRSGIADISPYTARHTVSTQLVVNGVHPHVKDQILGHAADDMSRHYTHVPQAPLIEAINTLPVIPSWRDAEWMREPLVWQSKLVRWGKAVKEEREWG